MWSIWLRVFPTGEVQVYLWMFRCGNIVLLTNGFFDMVKFTVLTLLSLLSWCRLWFLIVGFKKPTVRKDSRLLSLPNFALKFPKRIFIWYWGKWSKRALILHKTLFGIITLLHSCSMDIQNNDITPATFQNSLSLSLSLSLSIYIYIYVCVCVCVCVCVW